MDTQAIAILALCVGAWLGFLFGAMWAGAPRGDSRSRNPARRDAESARSLRNRAQR